MLGTFFDFAAISNHVLKKIVVLALPMRGRSQNLGSASEVDSDRRPDRCGAAMSASLAELIFLVAPSTLTRWTLVDAAVSCSRWRGRDVSVSTIVVFFGRALCFELVNVSRSWFSWWVRDVSLSVQENVCRVGFSFRLDC